MHLLTFTAFDGKLGLAFVASSRPFDWGGMCSNADTWKKEALNTGVSTFMDPQGNRQLAVVSMSTVAHGNFTHILGVLLFIDSEKLTA